jgi:hypothetical protein
MFAAFFHVHYKINHIKAFAVGFAIAAKAIGCMGFPVELHTWGFIIMERAVNSIVLVGFKPVMLHYFGKGQVGFDLLNCHVFIFLWFSRTAKAVSCMSISFVF